MKILIVGLGSIGKKHLNAIYKLQPNSHIFRLVSAQSVQKKAFGYLKIQNINQEDLQKFKFDYAIIANPSSLHYNVLLKLIPLNIPIFLEKPPVLTVDQLESIIDIVKSGKNYIYIACNLRFHPIIKKIKEKLEVDKPKINEVNIYCGSYLPVWRKGVDYSTTYSAQAKMGGGVHLDMYHEFDYIYYLFGNPIQAKSFRKKKSNLLIDSIDSAVYIMEFNHFHLTLGLNYFRIHPKREIEIIFENEIWNCDIINNCIKITNELESNEICFNTVDTYFEQMNDFIKNINTNTLVNNNPIQNSLEILKTCLTND